jgi:peptidoglycan/xylan/chitin deacetylase (PgdA/CDA1 family)
MSEFVAYLLWLSGLSALIRATIARNAVTILLYHDPSPAVFDRHINYLKRDYTLLPFAKLIDAIYSKDWSKIHPRSVVVHIDDGYRENAELLEICRRHGLCPTLYLCSHIAATNRHFWSSLKESAYDARLLDHELLLRKLHEEAGFATDREYADRAALNEDEIREMKSFFDFQSHGRFHFSLLTLDEEMLEADLVESRQRVEDLTGRECAHFAFPFGDYGKRECEAVRQCGYLSARTTEPGWVRAGTDPYRLPIVADVPGDISVNVLRAHLTCIPRSLKRLVYRVLTRHVNTLKRRTLATRRYF